MDNVMRNQMIAGATLYCCLVSIPGFAAGTLEVEESITVNANPAAVWALAGNFNGLDRWHPAISKSHQVEDVRTLTLQDGAIIIERLTNYDAQGQHYSYAIMSGPLPVKDYQSTLRVESAKDHTSKVTWSSTFEASGAADADADAKAAIQGIYKAGLTQLNTLFN
jgi:hypothetical protein